MLNVSYCHHPLISYFFKFSWFFLPSSLYFSVSFCLSRALLLLCITLQGSPEVCRIDTYHPSTISNEISTLKTGPRMGATHVQETHSPPYVTFHGLLFVQTPELFLLLPALRQALLSAAIFHQRSGNVLVRECPHMLPSLSTLVLLTECCFFMAMSEEQILKVGGVVRYTPSS